MTYFFSVVQPEDAHGQVKEAYDMLTSMFEMVPKVFVAQSIRPDLLAPMVTYVNRLMIETRTLPRKTKELIAAHVSRLNQCVY